MGLYETQIFPRLMDWVMARPAFSQLREALLQLASGEVLVLYHGGPDEGGLLTFVSQRPTQVETERLPLPLARMAASPLTGDWLTLQAFADHALTNLAVSADRRSVILTQFVRTF